MNVGITINGKKRYVRDRISVFEACREAGVYIPHFCYHPKLSIPANCRMCLVDIEKMPKPVPSCATMVTDGMIINTESEKTKSAQKGVMEFLLINHPLDCPICDQGGECQLQDLAVGYGSSCSRYQEKKRVVVEKHLGSLISTVMTRCIHCTRCVRFGEEIGGELELGMAGRGEHSEIMPFIEKTIDSEISGNMIDICPVGALNSKPFRFTARTWELDRANGIAQHDSWGSMITLQYTDNEIKRVLPFDREEINECWLSDRDRFSYTGMNVPARLLNPHVKDNGSAKPRLVEWEEALEVTVAKIKEAVAEHGADNIGVLIGPSSVSEEALLAGDLIRGLGSSNIDVRLRQRDFKVDHHEGIPWMGCSIEELNDLDSIIVVGSNPARELPLFPVRIRRRQKNKTLNIYAIGSSSLQNQFQLVNESVVPPSQWINELTKLLVATNENANLPKGASKETSEEYQELIKLIKEGKTAILLGNEARNHANYSTIKYLAKSIANELQGFDGLLVEGANTIGCSLAGAVPNFGFMNEAVPNKGLNAKEMIEKKLPLYILLNCEPLDFVNPLAAKEAFSNATTIHIGGYSDIANDYANILLPAAIFAERKGAMVSIEGNAATMEDIVLPPGEVKPAWKILRMLGSMLELPKFTYQNIEELRERLISAGDFGKLLINKIDDNFIPTIKEANVNNDSFERILNTAHYSLDQLTRRAEPLQETSIASKDAIVMLHPEDLAKLDLIAGDLIKLTANDNSVECEVGADENIAVGCIRAPWGVEVFANQGDSLELELAKISVTEEAVVMAN